ncbi:MAG: aldolase/citrate lyase family protein [Albidovulum sp.]|nr:aldolase/citrate lyase family protein [Albidovulum sp.]
MADFRELLRTKRLKAGTYIGEFDAPGMAAILGSAGCEFAFVDMEHSGFSFQTAKALLRSLRSSGIATMLRPPSKSRRDLALACDIGAEGIIPPLLETESEARACVDAIKYHPDGSRGCAFGIAHDDYRPAPVAEAMEAANRKTSFIALIESATGVENCDGIAATEGVDCLWIGHFDLSASLGIPGDFENPRFKNAVAAIMAAAAKHGKSAGRLVASADEGVALFREGNDFICYLGDVWLLQRALSGGLSAIRSAIPDCAIAGKE